MEQWKYWGASRSKYLLLYLNLYFVLFGQLRISGRNRAAPRRTFVHISTSSCNPRGRAHIFAIWWLHTNVLYSQEARTCIACMYIAPLRWKIKNCHFMQNFSFFYSSNVWWTGMNYINSIGIRLWWDFKERCKNNLGRQQIQQGSEKKKKRNWSKT